MPTKTLAYTLSGGENKNFIETIKDVYKLRGLTWSIKYACLSLLSFVVSPFYTGIYKAKYNTNSLSRKHFIFKNKKYAYFSHTYNHTWKNERAIEVPLVKSYLDKYKNKRILEVGNVLSYYYPSKHDIVDNYEIAKGVINEDIMEYKPAHKYDLIFSISTVEHIGVDGVKDSKKALKTIQKLRSLLKKGGELLFTVPLGYNNLLDRAIFQNQSYFAHVYFLKKISQENLWIEITTEESRKAKYGFPFRWGNVICFAIIKNS